MYDERVGARAARKAAPWIFAVAVAIMPFAASGQSEISPGELHQGGVVAPKSVDLSAVPQVSASELKAMAARPQPPRPKTPLTDQQFAALKAAAAQQNVDLPNAEPLSAPAGDSTAGGVLTPGATVAFLGDNETEGCSLATPSDMGLAVGDTNVGVLQVTNFCISVFSKSGALQTGFPKSINTFLGLPAGSFVFDPRALYDWANHRYIMLFSEFDNRLGTNTGSYWVAVSVADDPTGGYFMYNLGSFFGPSNLFDFPRLGQDRQGIYVFSNVFPNAGGYAGEEWLLLPKLAMYAGANISFFGFTSPTAFGQLTDSTQPANVWSNTDNPRAEFMVTALNFFFGGGSCSTGCNGLIVWAISNPLVVTSTPGPELSGVVVPTTFNYFLPPNASQGGTTALIDTGDVRITGEVSYSAGTLYAALTSNFGSGRAGAILYQIHPVLNVNDSRCTGAFLNDCPQITTASMRNESLLFYVIPFSAYYPTQQPDPEGNVTTVFNFSGDASSTFAFGSTAYISQRVTQASNSFVDSGIFLAVGQNIYTQGRWGDYTAVAAAGLGGTHPTPTMWFAGMFTRSDTAWGTAIGKNGFTAPNQP